MILKNKDYIKNGEKEWPKGQEKIEERNVHKRQA